MITLFLLSLVSSASATPVPMAHATAVPFSAVHLHDNFWAPRIEINRTVTIPFTFEKCEETGRIANFDRAAKVNRGEPLDDRKITGYPFDESDVYKIIEGACYTLSVNRDPKLEAYIDNLIERIGAAQEKDGYLYTSRTINPEHPHEWSGPTRWSKEEDLSHELYDLGHLYESAVAHFQATGKRTYLNIAIKSADLLCRTFGPGKRKIWPGHQVVELGLAKLYRATGKKEYLDLAKFMLDSRGGSGEYWQAHKPVVDQDVAVGHAVRAAYMYTGMADVGALTDDPRYISAIDKIWDDVVSHKLYITGGIGQTGSGEAFGASYDLPNMTAYCETCAAVGNEFWNERLFLLHMDAKYVDVLERTLYNGLISGISLDGKSFFYPNPLESRGQFSRSPWFPCACCPGNMTRFVASVPGYFYAQQGNNLYVNLFASGTASITLDGGKKVEVIQETNYPWSGDVKLTVNPAKSGDVTMRVRIPGWARDQAVPSDLYRFADGAKAPVHLEVNGRPVPVNLEKGYATLSRNWKKGDVIHLVLPMPVRRVIGNAKIVADQGRIALQRGPVLYCAEWPESPSGHVRNLLVPSDEKLTPQMQKDLLGGVVTLKGTAKALAYDKEGKVVATDQPFTAIPYYAWANRGRGEMEVWLPEKMSAARPTPQPTLTSTAIARSSGGTGLENLHDGQAPKASGDESVGFFHWWPKKGTTEWVEYTFPAETTVSESRLYWFDDSGRGECRVPASWRLLYQDGSEWKPVEATGEYGVAMNKFNGITFKPVKTKKLRVEVKLQPNWSTGIQEWEIK